MREIITIGIGGAGCSMAHQFWRRVMREHTIDNSGRRTHDDGRGQAFFEKSSSNRFTPRALFVDLDPASIKQLRGSGIKVYHSDFMLSGDAGTGGNFARGRYAAGSKLIAKVEDRLQKLVDQTKNLQGFLIFMALGGGTGSGLGALVLERLTAKYRKKSKVVFGLFPAQTLRSSLVEHHNAVLTVPTLLDHSDITFVCDNDTLRRTCTANLNIKYPTYDDINELISRAAADITAGIRFETGDLADLASLQTKLIPSPRLQFVTMSTAPITTKAKVGTADTNIQSMMVKAVQDEPARDNTAKYLSAALVCRGPIAVKEINAAVSWITSQNILTFAPNMPTGLSQSLVETPTGSLSDDNAGAVGRTVTLLSNTTGIAKYLREHITDRFDQMFAAEAFVHAYVGAGLEPAAFVQARDNLSVLANDYEI